jgi:phosphopantothenoylcysteine decarboxylase/phosphopantothenate--cysteine ligase
MNVLVISGPASIYLDPARKILNQSTGRTGVTIADILQKNGFSATLWQGKEASWPLPSGIRISAEFRTVPELQFLLGKSDLAQFHAILVPAALPDYALKCTRDLQGGVLPEGKWPGSLPGLQIELTPGPRILPILRDYAPKAKIIGWKWETQGDMKEIRKIAEKQIQTCRTDGCVLNGPAYGDGYLLVTAGGDSLPCPTAAELGHALARYLKS